MPVPDSFVSGVGIFRLNCRPAMDNDWTGTTQPGFAGGVAPPIGRVARRVVACLPPRRPENRVRILLLTNDETLSSAVQSWLLSAGHECRSLRQPPSATDVAWQPDAMLVDGSLGLGATVDALERLRQSGSHRPELTPTEWQVIALLAAEPQRAVPRALVAQLIGDGREASANAVAVHLYNLRRKLGRHAIETIRGRGFRLRP